MQHLAAGRPAHGIARGKLAGNPYWPSELAQAAGRLAHERFVVLAPLALSRTQDDKGRVRWTLFGGSEQGPARAFWKGFFTAPDCELAAEAGLGFFRRLLTAADGRPPDELRDLKKAGFRILPGLGDPGLPYPQDEQLPSWTEPFLAHEGRPAGGIRYLLTFRPFGLLPQAIRRAYLAGKLHLLPFPGSLVFWGAPPFLRLRGQLPLAMQIPLLNLFPRHEDPYSLRVPQSGWMHEPHPDHPQPDPARLPLRNTYRRTHRWARIHRHEDELGVADGEDRVAHVLFSTAPDDLGLYGKPMARNAQVWTHDFRLLLDGPLADRRAIANAAAEVRKGGHFGYRFLFPPMHVGRHAVYWHRPLAACLGRGVRLARGRAPCAVGLLDRLPGRSAGPVAGRGALAAAVGPASARGRLVRLLRRARASGAAHLDLQRPKAAGGQRPLGRAGPAVQLRPRRCSKIPRQQTLEDWLRRLETSTNHLRAGQELAEELHRRIEGFAATQSGATGLPVLERPHGEGSRGTSHGQARGTARHAVRFVNVDAVVPKPPLTYRRTATRSFEVAYWRTIVRLAHGRYVRKDNADCCRDPVTQSLLAHYRRELEALGDYLLDYYRRVVQQAGMSGKAAVGELPFRWQTDFRFPGPMAGPGNQEGRLEERDLVVVIPGRDRRRAVIMADHYDTAYMEDRYEKRTAAMALDWPPPGPTTTTRPRSPRLGRTIFLDISRAGRLACDMWLVHFTGEEFPSDCMGDRHLAQAVVERTLKLRRPGRRPLDLSGVGIEGVYVLDMVAHNNDHEPDVFQNLAGHGPRLAAAGLPSPPGQRRLERGGAAVERQGGPAQLHPWAAEPRRGRHSRQSPLTRCSTEKSARRRIPAVRCSTPTARSSPTRAFPWCSLWRTTTSIASVITTRTTR